MAAVGSTTRGWFRHVWAACSQLDATENSQREARVKYLVLGVGAPGFSVKRCLESFTGLNEWFVSQVVSQHAWVRDNLRPDDVLLTIGDVMARSSSEDTVWKALLHRKSPIVLRFRADGCSRACGLKLFTITAPPGRRLGVCVIRDMHAGALVVCDVPAAAVEADVSVQCGDVLVAVNGLAVTNLRSSQLKLLVRKTAQPVVFTFQRWHCVPMCQSQMAFHRIISDDATDGEETTRDGLRGDVMLLWHKGPLGMTLTYDRSHRMPRVSRLTGQGTTLGLDRVCSDHLLAAINNVSTQGKSFRDTCRCLREAKKPARLQFILMPSK